MQTTPPLALYNSALCKAVLAFNKWIVYNARMETSKIKKVLSEALSEVLDLARDFESTEALDPKLPQFTVTVTIIARRDFPILHSIAILADDPLSGDAILDLSRRVLEDMISVEFMLLKGKEKMAAKFIKYSRVERWLDLEYLRKMGIHENPGLEKKIEDDFQKVRPQFVYKKDQIAQSWSSTRLELMIEELVKAKVITDAEKEYLLQGYITGNRKNHLSSRDTSYFADKTQRASDLEDSLRIGLLIAIVSYIRILSKYAEETGNNTLAGQLNRLFSKLNVPIDNNA
jgi:hypothetical protein